MSRATLSEELAGALPEDHRPVYEPGSFPTVDLNLLEAVIEIFLSLPHYNLAYFPLPNSDDLGPRPAWFNHRSDGLSSDKTAGALLKLFEATELENLDAQGFMDTFLREFSERADPRGHYYLDHVVSPLVQVLYDLGHNGLEIDASHLTTTPGYMASHLEGDLDEPLRLTYIGDVQKSFGNFTNRCELVFPGNAKSVGLGAMDGIFHALGDIGDAGFTSERTTFHVSSLNSVPKGAPPSHSSTFLVHDQEYGAFPGIRGWFNRTRRLKHTLDRLTTIGFFCRKETKGYVRGENRLYVRDGPDGWKEVTP